MISLVVSEPRIVVKRHHGDDDPGAGSGPRRAASDQAEKMALTIRKIGVIGAGQMGNGIAHVAALAGMDVLLNDISADRINAGLATINGNLTRQVSRKLISEEDRQAALDAHRAGRHARQARRLRSRHRVGDREGGGQAQDLRRSLPAPEGRRDRRHQHVVDLDHAACRLDRPAGEIHRHSLHESGAGDGAGRADPRHRHQRHDVRRVPRVRQEAAARPSRSRRISRPSSSTASCCR